MHLLLDKTWLRTFQYAPFQQFKERPTAGKFFNIHPAGFRLSQDQGPWPPDKNNFNIFVFGGSTAFGYGLPDEQTISSYLQKKLTPQENVKVYNFGTGYFFTAQSMFQFIRLIQKARAPDLAVFICGINDFHFADNTPQFTGLLSSVFNNSTPPPDRLLMQWMERSPTLYNFFYPSKNFKPSVTTSQKTRLPAQAVISNFFLTKKIIESVAENFDIDTLFVWQPTASYEYDYKNYHLFQVSAFDSGYLKDGYALFDQIRHQITNDKNFLWCADIQKNAQEALYVDNIHYNAVLSEKLAGCIASNILEKRLRSKN